MQVILTTHDISEKYDVTERTVRQWITDGKLPPPIKIGRQRFWLESTITEFLDSKVSEAAQAADKRRYTADGKPVHRMIR